ncbi:MAG TPA: pilus assembly protein TadG-related protein [Sphingomicrobium sp.]|nr:pilus assembly protein TadG-related protein [Sphingomicrobium sp.]
MLRPLRTFLRSADGAVAPTIALSLAALIAAGGIAFDYARLASMDTELQSAADQAALAAATQLDGEANARARATAAAQNLVANLTYFANDGGTNAVTVPTVIFYSDYNPDTGAKGPVASGDADANYVLVTVGERTAKYALTPIVAAFNSGKITASAFATLDSAWCNLPPFMMCAPTPGFNPDDHIGAGIHMIIGAPNTPGNFGFLQTGFGTGAANLAKAIGWNGSAGGCVATRGMPTEPGDKVSVRAAVNTRFDMSEGGQTCPAGGTCSPSTNARKDLVHANTGSLNQRCSSSGNRGWSETANPYRAGTGAAIASAGPFPDIMGHPPDLCHMAQPNTCGVLGDGNWDRDAYFKVNYNWDAAGSGSATAWTTMTGLSSNVSRYQVYLWEASNPLPPGAPGKGIGAQQGPYVVGNGSGGGTTDKFTDSAPVCRPPGIPPDDAAQDRRRTTVAVVDCSAGDPNGRDEVHPLAWMDVFLVEPSFRRPGRTDGDEVYAEIIRSRPMPGIGQTIDNVVRRDVPRLLE